LEEYNPEIDFPTLLKASLVLLATFLIKSPAFYYKLLLELFEILELFELLEQVQF